MSIRQIQIELCMGSSAS